jgi:hypothetical protein
MSLMQQQQLVVCAGAAALCVAGANVRARLMAVCAAVWPQETLGSVIKPVHNLVAVPVYAHMRTAMQ